MTQRIDTDQRRFRDIVRGRIKRNLKQYISQGELIGKQGADRVSIPVPQIDIPHFKYGQKQNGGVGQGDGEPGDSVQGDGQGKGSGRARPVILPESTRWRSRSSSTSSRRSSATS
jgi:uncharacterized sporulation protein YeaH/YhbH (DUF444 family)